jgi:phosphoglucomutase
VLQFITADGGKVSVRPSGTEPKIKFYFGVVAPLSDKSKYAEIEQSLTRKIEQYIKDLGV